MKQLAINIAKKIYQHTPWLLVRSFLFNTFCSLVKNREVLASIDGVNFRLDLGEVVDLCLYLGRYEPDMTAAIETHCQTGYTVLDIGANIGAHALRLAKIVGDSGKVYAFEPTDYAYNKLAHNISLNWFTNIVPQQLALSDVSQPQKKIRFRSSWPTNGQPIERESNVDFIRLDDWCKNENVRQVDLIKLDVDGNEYSVIMGALSLLSRQHPPILMEVWGPNFVDDSKNPFIVLQQIGYKFFHIETGEEYAGIADLRALVSQDGELLDFSISIVARC